ncbi:methyltransferase domain-containing protein [Paenibacillus sp. UNC499MF]|uniref:methyltransferase domain-containing protein n=1 Tax=Paenibacillus sp. UNC499MF TaxID=1502751 RepID=UPI0008A05411|nr:methyltransferase domain-containing protein [Paenibacillus sp. UNC499MF]SEG66244.1 Methyltransferase domain-containing protein [Paenibacillus sp. UNC499MF]
MKIDLGCGLRKHPGYIGIDKEPLPGVDLQCDLNEGIPLGSDTVDFVMASRSLEYVPDLMNVMKEIYRVCRHKAVVCLLAPYAHTSYHAVNPNFRSWFDEQLPRFFTNELYVYDPLRENTYMTDVPAGWDKASRAEIDLRLLRCEFFYLPQYLSPIYDDEDRRMLRQSTLNVVDEILYYFVAVKEPISERELEELAQGTYEEPLLLTERRREEAARAESRQPLESTFRHEPGSVLPQRDPLPVPRKRRKETKKPLKKKTASLKPAKTLRKKK